MKEIKEKFYDFVVTDFDGTIFNSMGEVSKETVDTVKGFISRGGTFCVCTGRMTGSIIPLLKRFGLDSGYVISYNGAEISKIETGEKVYKAHIDNKTTIKLLKYAELNSFDLMVYPNDVITFKNLTENAMEYVRLNQTKANAIDENVSAYFQQNNLTTGKALFLTGGKDDISSKILHDLPELVGAEVDFTKSNKFHVDVMKKGVSKGETIKEFAKIIGKDLSKLVCFGDQMNDFSMMKVCALSAVTANGADALKAVADVVVDDCNANGVSKAINKYCI